MKKFIIIVFICVVSNISFSQILYTHYLDQTCQWREGGSSSNAFYYEETFRTIYFDGTENYNGYTYYREKFLTRIDYYEVNSLICITSVYYDPIEYNLIREDASGKIYRRLYNQFNVEELALDNQTIINAQLGDPIPNTPYVNFASCPVNNIATINIANINLKHLSGIDGPNTGLIEGIGVVRQGCGGDVGGLVCFTKQGQTVQFVNMNCNLFPNPANLSTNSAEINKPSIFPNPTNSEFSIILQNEKIKSVELFDMQGRKLMAKRINDLSTKLDISLYEKGTYFVLINTESKAYKEKIIKK